MEIIQIVTVRGVKLFRWVEDRKVRSRSVEGRKVRWTLAGESAQPNSFAIWHHTAREAIEGPCTASTGAGV